MFELVLSKIVSVLLVNSSDKLKKDVIVEKNLYVMFDSSHMRLVVQNGKPSLNGVGISPKFVLENDL